MKPTPSICLLLATLAAALPAQAGWEFGGSGAIGYNSIYEFRGVDLGADMVETSAGLTAKYGDLVLGASLWYAAVNDNPTNPTPDELDMTLSFTKPIGPVTLTGGYIYYDFENANASNTQELYLGASMEVYAGVAASATVYRDVDLFDGWYFDVNLSKSFEISSCLSLVATAGCGFADDNGLQLQSNGDALDGFNQWYLSVSMPWKFREGFTLAPYLRYVDADSDLVSDIPGGSTGDDHLVYGLKLSFEF